MATAPGQSVASSVRQPHALSCSRNTSRLVALSSTTRTRSPLISTAATGSRGLSSPSFLRNTAVKKNVDPLPSLLFTSIVPPMALTSCLQIVSPSPVPPYFRVVEASTWVKASNSCSLRLAGMPIPVSVTSKRTACRASSSEARLARITTSPFSVNLIALFTRLMSTCRRRPGSPFTRVGTS